MTPRAATTPDVHEMQWLESLQTRQLITAEMAQRLRELHRTTKRSIAMLLQHEPASDDAAVGQAIAERCGVPWLLLDGLTIDPRVLTLVPARLAEAYHLLPVRREAGTLVVALGDLSVLPMLEDVRVMLKMPVRAQLTNMRQWRRAFLQHYGMGAVALETLDAAGEHAARASVVSDEDALAAADEQQVAQLVQQLMLQAHRDRATDVHVQPQRDTLRIRERIDGVLYDMPVSPGLLRLHPAILSRLKILARLNIAERRLPQDGRFQLALDDGALDLRLSTLPTPYGESADIRLLSMKTLDRLDQLGFFPEQLDLLERWLGKPHGIIFVTGPTGSGKTTTLYAALRTLNTSHVNIITIEDPIEQRLDGVTQIQVHPKIDLTFARGLRSVLRHDPDVIMVGEVRDSETAEIAIRSAMTGHLVLSTLHTNDAASGVARLLDMGIEPYLLASSVECFIAQRLVRVVCEQCRRPAAPPTPEIMRRLGASELPREAAWAEGAGCAACKQTGFRGRTGIFEVLVMTEELRELVLRRASAQELKRVALQQGMRMLAHAGWEKSLQGTTTLAEILRVT